MVDIITFGCRLNFYESDVIRSNLSKTNTKNLTIIHGCAVTNEAERQVKQAIRKAKREKPDKEIIVIGCGSELHKQEYENMPEVSKALGNKEKFNYRNYVKSAEFNEEEIPSFPIFQDRARAFVQIQNGCNHSCTFCCITHARGENKSVPISKIVNQVETLLKNGHQEIVLTGVDITDFGSDLLEKSSLGMMIRRLLNTVPNLTRLRLSSIDVAEIDNELFNLIISEPRLMPHIHISAQSGDNMILKRMKRRHNREQVVDFCKEVKKKRPEVVFGADMIAGFPTETEEMFANSYDMITEAGISYLHVFPYSSKEGTPASKMPQVDPSKKKERARLLRDLGSKQLKKLYESQIGIKQEIIVEKEGYGRAENFALVKLNCNSAVGKIIKVSIVDNNEDKYLMGIL